MSRRQDGLGMTLTAIGGPPRSRILRKPVRGAPSPFLFKQHRQTDYEHVQAVRDQRAREACVAFYLRGVIEVAGEAAETAPISMQKL